MPGLMTFKRDVPLDRFLLPSQVDQAHAPFADLLHQLVRSDIRADLFFARRIDGGSYICQWPLQKTSLLVVNACQGHHTFVQTGVISADLFQVLQSSFLGLDLPRTSKMAFSSS